jgi:hypothetical protein
VPLLKNGYFCDRLSQSYTHKNSIPAEAARWQQHNILRFPIVADKSILYQPYQNKVAVN